jgi:hypothetical protein
MVLIKNIKTPELTWKVFLQVGVLAIAASGMVAYLLGPLIGGIVAILGTSSAYLINTQHHEAQVKTNYNGYKSYLIRFTTEELIFELSTTTLSNQSRVIIYSFLIEYRAFSAREIDKAVSRAR